METPLKRGNMKSDEAIIYAETTSATVTAQVPEIVTPNIRCSTRDMDTTPVATPTQLTHPAAPRTKNPVIFSAKKIAEESAATLVEAATIVKAADEVVSTKKGRMSLKAHVVSEAHPMVPATRTGLKRGREEPPTQSKVRLDAVDVVESLSAAAENPPKRSKSVVKTVAADSKGIKDSGPTNVSSVPVPVPQPEVSISPLLASKTTRGKISILASLPVLATLPAVKTAPTAPQVSKVTAAVTGTTSRIPAGASVTPTKAVVAANSMVSASSTNIKDGRIKMLSETQTPVARNLRGDARLRVAITGIEDGEALKSTLKSIKMLGGEIVEVDQCTHGHDFFSSYFKRTNIYIYIYIYVFVFAFSFAIRVVH